MDINKFGLILSQIIVGVCTLLILTIGVGLAFQYIIKPLFNL
ncbi:hypothetical protein JOC54_001607 [Alkalihalobacillus xiaoxiensis]|uniref:Uncharacterized protein n=1 Tax=Shouchella xiaoxiensis TaxID=766895 RepID=A0ABS2ST41_9BACI|nr:hypothetical protein [Shouchella xiaoxiensis]